MTIEEFTTKKRAKLLGYLVGRYYTTHRRRVNPSKFTLVCFSVIVNKFFTDDWMIAVLAGSNGVARFVTEDAQHEYISGYSLAIVPLGLTLTETEKVGVLIPEAAMVGESEGGGIGMGALVLSRYTRPT